MTSLVVSGLLTYLLHSSALILLAWLASHSVARRDARHQQSLWRVALLGGLLTATLPLTFGLTPAGGQWTLGAGAEAAPPAMALMAPSERALLPPLELATPAISWASVLSVCGSPAVRSWAFVSRSGIASSGSRWPAASRSTIPRSARAWRRSWPKAAPLSSSRWRRA
jgi:hypothetical protein